MSDPINPSHYQAASGAQLIDFVENLTANRYAATKYLVRAGYKDPGREVEDLEKALWFVQRELFRLGASEYNPADPDTVHKVRM
jgi:hypothetical protein